DEVTIVRIPVDADVGDAVVGPKHGHYGHARFGEVAGWQARLAVDVHAIALADGLRLQREIEGAGNFRRGQEREGAAVMSVQRSQLGLRFQAAYLLFDPAQELLPA